MAEGSGLSRVQAGRYRTLLVAPHSDLGAVDKEIQRVMNALTPRLLYADVTVAQLLDELQRSQYDIVWFAGHSGPQGLQLEDGVLDAQRLVQLLRQQKPKLVFLNSCSSLSLAMDIHQEVGATVIATVQDVADELAFTTGAQLAGALASGMNIEDAYAVSRPGANRQYVLLGGKAEKAHTETEAHELVIIRLLNEWGSRILDTVDTRIDGLEKRIDTVESKVGKVEGKVDRIAANTNRLNATKRWFWAVGFFMLFVPVVGFFSGFREVMGVSWGAAYGFALLCYFTSFILFAVGQGVISVESLIGRE